MASRLQLISNDAKAPACEARGDLEEKISRNKKSSLSLFI
jgi:hypothetical protein